MEIISVSKSYSHRGNHRHRLGTKRRWYAYFLSEDGRFGRKRINLLSVPFYKARIKKHLVLCCSACGGLSHCFFRNKKEYENEVCPYCGSPVADDEDDDAIV